MSKHSSVVSLAELDGYRSDTLTWDLKLPEYVPADRIGVNVGALGRIARLGGLSHVRVGVYDGDRTQDHVGVSNLGPDGAATASMSAAVTKAQTVKTDLEVSDKANWIFSEYWWADASIDINAIELGDKVLDRARKEGSLRDGSLWAHYLNKDLKRGMSQSTREQLLGNVSGVSKAYAFLAGGFIIGANVQGFSPENLAVTASFFPTIVQLFATSFNYMRGIPIRERRLSFIPGYQLDRLVAVQGLLKTHKLVKPI